MEYKDEQVSLFKRLIVLQRNGDGPSPIEAAVLKASWYEPKHGNNTSRKKITNVHGSMLVSTCLADLVALEEKDRAATHLKCTKQGELRELYNNCKGGCVCEGQNCKAKGFFLCMSCDPVVGVMKKKVCGVKACIAAHEKLGAARPRPLPNKGGAPSRGTKRNSKALALKEHTDDESEDSSDSELPDGGVGGRVSDLSDAESAPESRSDDEDGTSSSDEDALFGKSLHCKEYNWEEGALYKVYWSEQKRYLIGQYCGPARKTGVTMYYADDDTVCMHKFNEQWHILKVPQAAPDGA
jgi:hypothetical protein